MTIVLVIRALWIQAFSGVTQQDLGYSLNPKGCIAILPTYLPYSKNFNPSPTTII